MLVVISIYILYIYIYDYSHIEFLKILLEYNSKLNPEDEDFSKRKFDLTKPDKNFQLSAIEYAIIFGRIECVKLLFDYGVPVTLMKNKIKDEYGYYSGNEEVFIIIYTYITLCFIIFNRNLLSFG